MCSSDLWVPQHATQSEGLFSSPTQTMVMDAHIPLNLTQSGGPASCVVVILTGDAFEVYRRILPLTRLGVLTQK